ncbi:MAG: hypothetical protein PVF58_16140 [Candidatus Methanofastidiosia archaeon]|jgi:hypothetical protein
MKNEELNKIVNQLKEKKAVKELLNIMPQKLQKKLEKKKYEFSYKKRLFMGG